MSQPASQSIGLAAVLAFPVFKEARNDAALTDSLHTIRQNRFFQFLPAMAVVNILVSSVTVYHYSGIASFATLVTWYVPIVVFSLFQLVHRYALAKKYEHKPPVQSSGRSVAVAAKYAPLFGAWWCLPCLTFLPWNSDVETFLLYIPLGMAAGVCSMMLLLPMISSRFLMGVLVMLAITFIFKTPQISEVILPMVLISSCAYSSLWSNAQFVNEMRERSHSVQQGQAIRNALAEFPGAMAHWDAAGKLAVANEAHARLFADIAFDDARALNSDDIVTVAHRHFQRTVKRDSVDHSITLTHIDITELLKNQRHATNALDESMASARALNAYLATSTTTIAASVSSINALTSGLLLPQMIDAPTDERRSILKSIAMESSNAARVIDDLEIITQSMRPVTSSDYLIVNVHDILGDAFAAISERVANIDYRVRVQKGSPHYVVTNLPAAFGRSMALAAKHFLDSTPPALPLIVDVRADGDTHCFVEFAPFSQASRAHADVPSLWETATALQIPTESSATRVFELMDGIEFRRAAAQASPNTFLIRIPNNLLNTAKANVPLVMSPSSQMALN